MRRPALTECSVQTLSRSPNSEWQPFSDAAFQVHTRISNHAVELSPAMDAMLFIMMVALIVAGARL